MGLPTCVSTSSSSWDALRAIRFGSTSFATKWYLFIARTHWHMAVHALETDSIFFGVKSSFSMYGCTFWITFSGMLSLSNENIDSRSPLASESIFLPGSQ